MNAREQKTVDARPVKRFFVEMLTRDIQIEDAILDLLDNCVDGIMRNQMLDKNSKTPYEGFWARITITENSFELEDNCGGIPWSLHDLAFRMGRPRAADPSTPELSVGVYGIGMKRAIFKLGQSAFVMTKNGSDNYQVWFSEEWMNDEDNWELEVTPNATVLEEDGTHLSVQNLNQDVKVRFNAKTFNDELIKKIASHYSIIIEKGFKVEVNGQVAKANSLIIKFASESSAKDVVRPYIYRNTFDDVEVFVAVGLRETIPGVESISDEQESGNKRSSDYAGWTVVCNDRIVLYCDRSELTGWGIFGVPRYHTQFIAISGVVEFRGDPRKLPTTTTKRGLKFESSLYQQVLQRMIEGIKHFIGFTNKWKTLEREAERLVDPVSALSFPEIKSQSQNLDFHSLRAGIGGEQYTPRLPAPERSTTDVRITYTRSRGKVNHLAEKLLPDLEDIREKDIPKLVGAASFDFAYNHFLQDQSQQEQ